MSASVGQLVIRNTFLELVEEKSPSQPHVLRAKTDTLALRSRGFDEESDSTGYGTSGDEETPEETPIMNEDEDEEARGRVPAAVVAPGAAPAAEPQQSQKSKAKTAAKPKGQHAAEKPKTTLMLRNIPNDYTRQMLLDLLKEEGFEGKYDFVYLPVDLTSSAGLGYAFVNVADPQVVPEVWAALDGYKAWTIPTYKVCEVGWGDPHQGLMANVRRYRNSPIMHESVPDEYKPMLFTDGARTEFPKPQKKLRAPRNRGRW